MKRRTTLLFLLMIACALLFGAQSRCAAQTDMTGYWKFSSPTSGLDYLQLKQTGETVSTAGRRPLTGTLHAGKLHLASGTDANATTYDAVVKGDKFPATRITHDGPWGGTDTGTLERVT